MKLSLRFIRLQMKMQFKLAALSYVTFAVMFLQPIVYSLIALVLGGAFSRDPMQVIISVVGGGLLGVWGNVMYISAFDITRDRWDGVLEQIVGSPVDISQILRIRSLTNVLVGCCSVFLSFFIAAILFDFRISAIQTLWLLLSIIVTLIGFWSMGILLANINAATRKSKLLLTAIDAPIMVLSGFMFPVELLPGWMQWIASIIPIRWAGSAIQTSLSSQMVNGNYILLHLALTLLISGVYYLLSKKLAVVVHDKIRINGEARYV